MKKNQAAPIIYREKCQFYCDIPALFAPQKRITKNEMKHEKTRK
jgi:hypothetical protein